MASEKAAAPTLREAQPVRQKSGLVRTAGGFDSFVFSLSGISVGIMVSWGLFFGNGFYFGSHILIAIAIATAVALPIALAYHYWGTIFPRSGGDYVYVSRGLHPGVALGANFIFVFVLMASTPIAYSISQPLVSSFAAAVSDAAGGWGFLDRFSGWSVTSGGYALLGSLALLIMTVISIFGLKKQIRTLQVLFLTGLIGSAVLLIALLFADTSTFVRNLEAETGLTAAQITQTAKDNGFVFGQGIDLYETLKLSNWFVISLFFALILCYIGGEIKNVQRNLRRGLIGAVVFSGVLTLFWVEALNRLVPTELQGALAYNNFVVPEASTLQLAYPHELMRILWGTGGPSLALTLIGYLTILAWILLWYMAVLAFGQRAVLAWSLDGLIPRWASNVSERWHTSIPSLLIVAAMVLAWSLAFSYYEPLRTIILVVPIFGALGVTMAVGVFFPYIRKDLFEQSIVAKAKIAGVPIISIVCFASAGIIAFWSWMLWHDPVASGTDRRPVWASLALLGVVVVYYVALRKYKRRQGEDISVTFKRIPVE